MPDLIEYGETNILMTKKQLFLLLLLISTSSVFTQTVKSAFPTDSYLLEFSPENEKKHLEHVTKCNELWEKEILTNEDKKYLESCDETDFEFWDAVGEGCSWYCGGGPDSLSASSFLPEHKGISYSFENIHDLSFKHAWVEGVKGYGIGEYVEYHFNPKSPRVTDVIVANGYVKSEKAWRENSRVKELLMYINNEPFAMLQLRDERSEQHFSFEPIGRYSETEKWVIKFEIKDVYKGDKYDDTVISEIYFNGIDVH